MKLITLIAPRADGVVVVRDDAGKAIVFASEAPGGPLVANVADEALVAKLLLTENFEPADEADFQAAEVLLDAVGGQARGEEDDDFEDEGDPNALPVEANTPPKQPAKAASPALKRATASTKAKGGQAVA